MSPQERLSVLGITMDQTKDFLFDWNQRSVAFTFLAERYALRRALSDFKEYWNEQAVSVSRLLNGRTVSDMGKLLKAEAPVGVQQASCETCPLITQD